MHNAQEQNIKKVYLSATSDCILAKYELEHLHTYFKINGWDVVDDKKDAEMIILNTCGLVPYKERESLDSIDNHLQVLGRSQELVLTGCLVKMNCSELDDKFRGFRFGRTEAELLDKYVEAQIPLNSVKNFTLFHEDHAETSFIRISQGCMGNCTYCAIKGTKGGLKSVPPEDVLQDIKSRIDQGSFYLVLLADDVGCYGADLNTDFAYLLEQILKIDRKFNMFIYNMEPSYLLKLQDKLIPLLKDTRIGTLKVPMQSGSQKILKLMNRNYDVTEVLALMDIIKAGNSNITLISHLIVGFPQETMDDMEQSLTVPGHFDEMVILTYGPREGLPSTKLSGQIPEEVKLERLRWMKERLASHNKAFFIHSNDGTQL